jgi:hypothetical protein
MNLRLRLLDAFLPAFVKSAKIRGLFGDTAAAFGVAMPRLAGIGYRELLGMYARFLKVESDRVLRDTRKAAAVRERLHQVAFEAGVRLKAELGIRNFDDALAASRLFYKVLGIDFSGEHNGTITIRKCLFGSFFTPANCDFVSAMDKGLALGLSGGVLEFTQRITEQKACCRAKILFKTVKEPSS